MPRHKKRNKVANITEYYEPLRKTRDVKSLTHYTTPVLRNPTVRQRAKMNTDKHIWKYGDRLYNLADRYYGDPTFWWIIAWWNGYGIEADIKNGAVLTIPLDLTSAIKILGV